MTPSVRRRNITPDDKHHLKLQTDVVEWLTGKGFIVESNAYHDKNTESFIGRLKYMTNVTSLIVRTQADRVALHTRADFAMYLEFKTISHPDFPNLAVEALPLAVHREKAKLGARCLYVVRDVIPGREYDGGFWADCDVPADSLFISTKHQGTDLEKRVRAGFPKLPVCYREHLGGSGDPFVRVPRKQFNTFMFPDWKTAILCEVPA